jgi:hypothetical protein
LEELCVLAALCSELLLLLAQLRRVLLQQLGLLRFTQRLLAAGLVATGARTTTSLLLLLLLVGLGGCHACSQQHRSLVAACCIAHSCGDAGFAAAAGADQHTPAAA